MNEDDIDIKIKHKGEFSSKIETKGNKYIVQTEDTGAGTCKIVTRTYLDGAIISTTTADYSHLSGSADIETKIAEMMESQHKSALSSFSVKEAEQAKTKAEFSKEILTFLKKGKKNAALDAVRQALEVYPSDPFFLSYFGFLIAAVEKCPKEGRNLCHDAIRAVSMSASEDKYFFYPIMYLNLGRVCLLARKKKDAMSAFNKGLKYDSKHEELLSEIRGIGFRKPPVIPFLHRGNPVNKFLGKLRHKLISK